MSLDTGNEWTPVSQSPDRRHVRYFNPRTRHIADVDHKLFDKPYDMLLIDVDDTALDSKNFYTLCWRHTFRALGIHAPGKVLDTLKDTVYQWHNDVTQSSIDAVYCIEQGVDIDGKPLPDTVDKLLKQLLNPKILSAWAEEFQLPFDPDSTESKGRILAAWKERAGVKILEKHPRVAQLAAPFKPGFIDFIISLPSNLPIALVSAANRETYIDPLLKAHASLSRRSAKAIDRFHGLVFGAEDSDGSHKPQKELYEQMVVLAGRRMNARAHVRMDRVCVIGNSAAEDLSPKRHFEFIIVGSHPEGKVSYGPLSGVVPDFGTLFHLIKKYPRDIPNVSLHRLAITAQNNSPIFRIRNRLDKMLM